MCWIQLRAGNGGANPAYGNPDKRPVFWPQHYWPWEQLNDVHSRPRGMEEPLNYSEMMKLAIARGYRLEKLTLVTFLVRVLLWGSITQPYKPPIWF